jgi:hypothetical protein
MAKNFQQGLVKKTQITAPLKAKVKLTPESNDDPTLRSLEAQLALMVGEDPVPASLKTTPSTSNCGENLSQLISFLSGQNIDLCE